MKYRPRKRLRGFLFPTSTKEEWNEKRFLKRICVKTKELNLSKQIKELRKQLRHTRFTMLDVMLSFTACPSYVQQDRTIEPIVKNIFERPGYTIT